jgi:hypothetical protein
VPSRSFVVKTSVLAIAIAVLYRYWLVTPVLRYLSIGKWFLIAVAVAAAIGCVMSLLRFSTLAQLCASVTGLLLGGTWAAWRVPNDVPILPSGAFESHEIHLASDANLGSLLPSVDFAALDSRGSGRGTTSSLCA